MKNNLIYAEVAHVCIYGTYVVGVLFLKMPRFGFFCSVTRATKKPDGRFYKFVNNY